jgi:undecaprenyl diphosphate synthase
MRLLEFFLDRETATLVKNKVRLLTIGRTEALPPSVRGPLERAKAATASFTEHTLVLALNYGARSEVLEAAESYALARSEGREPAGTPTWENFSRYLSTSQIPDPDLIIRTSGEMRISNFLLLQSAYSELVFTPVLWPDFGRTDLEAAIAEYQGRERRYGMTSEQVTTK